MRSERILGVLDMSFNEAVSKWETEKLSLLTDYISRGITPKYTDDNNRSILVVNQRCIREGKVLFDDARRHDIEKKKVSEEKFLRDFDVLVNSTGVGTLGRVSQIKKVHEPTTVDSHVTIVRGNGEYIDKKYLGYAIKAQQSIIENMAEGSTGQTELSRKRLGDEIVIGFPKNKQEQTAIAHILSTLDDKIEVNNEINKTLENMAQAIFKQWFVDFEFPNEDGEPYKSSGGEMIESELGMIPKGWEVVKLNSVVDICYGKNLPTKNLLSDGYPVFGGNGQIGFYSEYLYEKSQVLIACRGAASGKVIISLPYSFVTNNSLVLEQNGTSVTHEYLKQFCLENEFYNYATGSAQPQITIANLANANILIPQRDLMNMFSLIRNSIDHEVLSLFNENNKLVAIRDALLPKLMSGEIRVPLDEEGDAS